MIQKKTKIKNNSEEIKVTFTEHLAELRLRLLFITASFIIFSIIGYFFRHTIIDVFTAPLKQQLFFTSPLGGFEFTIQVSLLFATFLTIPLIIYHILGFLEPLFPKNRQFLINTIIFLSSIFLVVGLLSAYFIFIPISLRFLLAFDSDQIRSLITTKDYVSFVSFYLLSFALIFQLPLVFLLINAVHEISIKFLMKQQRAVIVISFIVGAILTPTMDILNQLIVSVPIILLYEISIVFLWIYKKKWG